MSKVHIKKTKNPSDLINLLNQMGLNFRGKKTAFIKPNVVIGAKPERAMVVDPALIRRLIDFLRKKGFEKFIIAEASGLKVDSMQAMLDSGYGALAKLNNVELVDIDKIEKVNKDWTYGKIAIPEMLFHRDVYYINLAKMKTHVQTTVTLGMKNQKGLITDAAKKNFHRRGLHEPIVELVKVVKPDLTIIDGIRGLEGDGPIFDGKPVKSQVLLASEDILSCDIVASKFMGMEIHKIKHITYAIHEKIGDPDPEIIGENLEKIKRNFKKASEDKFVFLRGTDIVNAYTCSMCPYSKRNALRKIRNNPKLALKKGPKLAYYFGFKGITFLYGKKAELPKNSRGKIICVGDCTKKIAKNGGWQWIPGCPPEVTDILDAF